MAGINLAKEKFEDEKKVKFERERLARLAEEQREAIKQMERERKEVVLSYTYNVFTLATALLYLATCE